jgi:hypothetical protein
MQWPSFVPIPERHDFLPVLVIRNRRACLRWRERQLKDRDTVKDHCSKFSERRMTLLFLKYSASLPCSPNKRRHFNVFSVWAKKSRDKMVTRIKRCDQNFLIPRVKLMFLNRNSFVHERIQDLPKREPAMQLADGPFQRTQLIRHDESFGSKNFPGARHGCSPETITLTTEGES